MKLSQAITEYVALKRAMGAGLDSGDARHLTALARADWEKHYRWHDPSQKTKLAFPTLTSEGCAVLLLAAANMLRYQASTALQLHVGTQVRCLCRNCIRRNRKHLFPTFLAPRRTASIARQQFQYRRKDALLQPTTVRMILLLLYRVQGYVFREALSLAG